MNLLISGIKVIEDCAFFHETVTLFLFFFSGAGDHTQCLVFASPQPLEFELSCSILCVLQGRGVCTEGCALNIFAFAMRSKDHTSNQRTFISMRLYSCPCQWINCCSRLRLKEKRLLQGYKYIDNCGKLLVLATSFFIVSFQICHWALIELYTRQRWCITF